MKKRVLALIALIVGVATLFTACGSGLSASVYYKEQPAKTYSAVTSLNEVNDYDSAQILTEDLVLFKKTTYSPENDEIVYNQSYTQQITTYYKVYNVNTKVFYDLQSVGISKHYNYNNYTTTYSGYEMSVISLGDLFMTLKTDYSQEGTDTPYIRSANVKIYNDSGVMLKSQELEVVDGDIKYDVAPVDLNDDTICEGVTFDGDFYRIVDSEISQIALDARETVLDLSAEDYEVYGEYVFDKSGNVVTVYDINTLQLVNYYRIPSYIEDVEVVYFANGNFLFQGNYQADQMSDEYSYLVTSTQKQTLYTALVKVDGDVKKVDCEYVLTQEWSCITEKMLEYYEVDGYDALMSVDQKIDNKRLIDVEMAMLGLDEDGSIEVIEKAIDNQDMQTMAIQLDNGNYIVADLVGMYYLYSADGELINNRMLGGASSYGNYFVRGKYIYSAKTFEEFTMPENYSVNRGYGDTLILQESIEGYNGYNQYTNTAYYTFKNGSINSIGTNYGSNYFTTAQSSTTTYSFNSIGILRTVTYTDSEEVTLARRELLDLNQRSLLSLSGCKSLSVNNVIGDASCAIIKAVMYVNNLDASETQNNWFLATATDTSTQNSIF